MRFCGTNFSDAIQQPSCRPINPLSSSALAEPAFETLVTIACAKFTGRLVVSTLLVTPEGEALVLQRKLGKGNSALWQPPGGKTHAQEEPRRAAAFEVLEETGFFPSVLWPLAVRTLDLVVPGKAPTPRRRVAPVIWIMHFLAFVDRPFTPIYEPHSHAGFCWRPLDSWPRPMDRALRRMLADFARAHGPLQTRLEDIRSGRAGIPAIRVPVPDLE